MNSLSLSPSIYRRTYRLIAIFGSKKLIAIFGVPRGLADSSVRCFLDGYIVPTVVNSFARGEGRYFQGSACKKLRGKQRGSRGYTGYASTFVTA